MIMDQEAVRAPALKGRVMVVEASVKRMATWTLWLILTCRTRASDVRVRTAAEHLVLIRTA